MDRNSINNSLLYIYIINNYTEELFDFEYIFIRENYIKIDFKNYYFKIYFTSDINSVVRFTNMSSDFTKDIIFEIYNRLNKWENIIKEFYELQKEV